MKFGICDDRRRASVLMEFLLVFPIIILLVSMLLQFAQIWIARQITAYAAYCATRATLCTGQKEISCRGESKPEEEWAAQYAAESVCAWMCLAGLSTDGAASLQAVTHDPLNWNKYHRMTSEVANDDNLDRDVSASRANEHNIPGWGSIPGSSSRHVRVNAKVLKGGDNPNYAAVRVRFKFPLIFPLAGRIISWAVAHPEEAPLDAHATYDSVTGTWSGDTYYSIHTGWHRGKETVMRDDGTAEDRSYATYGQDGKFPYIELTEICVLPRPYLTTEFDSDRYEYDDDGGGT